ncbi:transmembrane protein 156 isoform X2 [Tupaia chinensis]|nr:transmembrane protein 156 isoform X2 [Tupaia chinensis]XP_027624388.1 transmembrane protein 156 isoform X2 [Tupaia chinensis]XP_027624389.1 transmembrane protein 156 isoform X2 [Tupaia chinensis]
MSELSCLEVCLQPNLIYSLSFNVSFMTFLQPVRRTQIIMGIFLNHTSFQNFTGICQDITSCLVCESKENVDFISQEQTSKVLIMNGSMEVKENNFHSPCQHFHFTVAPLADHVEEYNTTCNLTTHTGDLAITEEEPTKEESINHTWRMTDCPHNCVHISLHLEMDVKNAPCSMKITWYILVLLVFVFLIILIIYKILEGHRKVQKWQSHKCKPTSGLLRGSGSEKLRELDMRVISVAETTQRLSLAEDKEVLPPIPELETTSMLHQQDQYT